MEQSPTKFEDKDIKLSGYLVSQYDWLCHGWPCPPGTQLGTINILQEWTSRTDNFWHISNHAEILYKSKESNMAMIHDVNVDPILRVYGQEPSTSSKYGLWGQGVPEIFPIMLESWNFAHMSKIMYNGDQ